MNESITSAHELPLRFPDWREEARARAEEFRRLAPAERWKQIAALMSAGFRVASLAGRREAVARRWAAEEAEWQRIQRSLFESHGQ